MSMNNRGRKHKTGKKIGQPFAPITVGDMHTLKRLGRNASRAAWVLACLRIESKGHGELGISDQRLAKIAGISTSTVYHALQDLIELNLIHKFLFAYEGRPNQPSRYQILPTPILQDNPSHDREGPLGNREANTQNRESPYSKPEEPPLEIREASTRNSRNRFSEFEKPIRIVDKQVDSIDNIDGKIISEKTCFEEIVEALSVIGVGKNRQYKLAVKIHDAGLTDEDVANAGKQAAMKVLKGQTRNSEGLDFTRGLSKTALESIGAYAIGIIENSIEQDLAEIAGPSCPDIKNQK